MGGNMEVFADDMSIKSIKGEQCVPTSEHPLHACTCPMFGLAAPNAHSMSSHKYLWDSW